MKKLVVLLLVSLMATSALAGLDLDENSIGVYFDPVGNVNWLENQAASAPFFVYVLIMNTTEAFNGLECSYDVVIPAGMDGMFFRLANILPAGAVDLGNSLDIFSGDYFYGLAAPVAPAEVVTAVTWQYMMLMGGLTMEFYLGASPTPSIDEDLPAMEIGGTIVPLGLASGDPALPCAGVNTLMAPVAEETTSFGGVKALFR